MIASKLILFFCFCLLLLDNSLGQEKESLLKRGSFKNVFDRAVAYGKTFGGDLETLTLKYNSLQKEIDQAERSEDTSKVDLVKLVDLADEVDDAEETVEYYEDLYGKNPSSENKEKLNNAKKTYSDKVASIDAIQNQYINSAKQRVRRLQKQQDRVAIAMIARMEKTDQDFELSNIRQKVKAAKENGLTDSSIKKILFAEYLRPSDVRLIGGGTSTGHALLSSFLAGMKSILDGTYLAKLRLYKEGREKSGAPEENDAPISSPTDGDYGNIEILEQLNERYPGLTSHRMENIEKWVFTDRIETVEEVKDGDEIIPGSPIGESPDGVPTFSSFYRSQAVTLVADHLDSVQARIHHINTQLESLKKDRQAGFYSDPSLQATPNLNHRETVELYTRRATHIQTSLDTLESIRQEHDELKALFQKDFNLTRDNFEYYAFTLGANPERFKQYPQLPRMPDDLDEFNDIDPEQEGFRYLISTSRMKGLILYGLEVDDSNGAIRSERFYFQEELFSLEDKLEDEEILTATEYDYREDNANPEDYLALLFLENYEGPGPQEAVNLDDIPYVEGNYTVKEVQDVENIVDQDLDLIKNAIFIYENDLSTLKEEETDGFQGQSSLREPSDRDLNDIEKLALYNRRVEHLNNLLETANYLIDQYYVLREQLVPRYVSAAENLQFYAKLLIGLPTDDEDYSGPSRPVPMDEFFEFSSDTDRMRYLSSNLAFIKTYRVLESCDLADESLKQIKESIENNLKLEQGKIAYLEMATEGQFLG